MTEQKVMITNKLGLHARAAAKLVHTANAFTSEVFIGGDHEEVNAKSILGLLTLAASKGSSSTWVRGPMNWLSAIAGRP